MGEEVPARAAAEEPPPPGLPLSRSPRRPPPIEFLQRCDSKVTPVYDINVTGSSGLDGAAVRRRRRRSSSAEDLQRLERLKEIRESMKTESPRKPSSIHTDTLSPRRSFELDEFRTEELARIAAGERDRVSFARGSRELQPPTEPPTPTEPNVVTPGGSPPPELSTLFLAAPAAGSQSDRPPHRKIPTLGAPPAPPLRKAAPATKAGAEPAAARPTTRRRRTSSINIPDRSDIDAELRRPKSANDLPGVEFISPHSPRAEPFSPGGTAQVTIDVDVGSPLAPPDPKKDRVSFAQAPEEPQSPPTPTDPAGGKADEKCVVS